LIVGEDSNGGAVPSVSKPAIGPVVYVKVGKSPSIEGRFCVRTYVTVGDDAFPAWAAWGMAHRNTGTRASTSGALFTPTVYQKDLKCLKFRCY
jgi:hypothetical protein